HPRRRGGPGAGPRPRAGEGLDPGGPGPGLLPHPARRRRPGGVREGPRARPGQRLRPLRPRPVPPPGRRPGRRPGPPEDGHDHEAPPGGLPEGPAAGLRLMPAVVLDLDGVLWLGDEPLPGAADAVARFRAAGLAVGFMTNNSSLPVAGYVEKLGRLGVPADPSEVLTSALAAADLLAGSGPGVVEALEARGFEVVDSGPAEAVVVGWHRTFDFDRLDRASAAIR